MAGLALFVMDLVLAGARAEYLWVALCHTGLRQPNIRFVAEAYGGTVRSRPAACIKTVINAYSDPSAIEIMLLPS